MLIEDFGEIVKAKRNKLSMSQTQLSLKVFDAPNHSYISNLENGKLDTMTLWTVEKFCLALDIDLILKEDRTGSKKTNQNKTKEELFERIDYLFKTINWKKRDVDAECLYTINNLKTWIDEL